MKSPTSFTANASLSAISAAQALGRFALMGGSISCNRGASTALISACVLGAVAFASPAFAQVQRTMINPSFEANDPGGPGAPTWAPFSPGVVPGWESTDTAIELWDTNFLSVPAASGAVFAEMNYNTNATLYQNLCLINGETFNWRFAHRARSGAAATQTARFEIASTTGTLIQTIFNSAVSNTTAWTMRSGTAATYTGTSGIKRVQFTTADAGSNGNFLDDIQISLKPFLEFSPASTSSVEGAASPTLPQLLISGTFATATAVTINITGGTAIRGTDYTTPGGAASFTVNIPAGVYNAQAFPLGIVVLNDNIVEGAETITFSITPNNAAFLLQSTASCGTAGANSATHTINDEAIVATNDSASGINGFAGAANVLNVLTNDILESAAPTPSNVTISVVTPATPISGSPVPALNTATGMISVPAGARSGTYTITYRICETLASTNCANAVATIIVAPWTNLQISKSNGVTTVVSGGTVTYTVTATNAGPDTITGALVTDLVGSRVSCPTGNNVAISGSGVPAGTFTIANLTGAGIALGTLATGQSAILTYSCQVN